jgi:hypothetical protein
MKTIYAYMRASEQIALQAQLLDEAGGAGGVRGAARRRPPELGAPVRGAGGAGARRKSFAAHTLQRVTVPKSRR